MTLVYPSTAGTYPCVSDGFRRRQSIPARRVMIGGVTDDPTTAPLLIERTGRVLTVTLNRPRVGNSIDMAMASGLLEVFSGADATLAAIVLRSTGKVFCAGGDVGEFARADDAPAFISALAGELHRAMLAMQSCPVPVVAAVHGNAGGAGLGLIAACDIAIAVASARFRPAYIALGLTPDAGLSWRLVTQLGRTRTLDLLMTDGELDAPEAKAAGILSRVTDDLDAEVVRVIDILRVGPSGAFARLKQLVDGAAQRPFADQLEREAASIAAAAASPDGQEGIASFTERRPARFD